MSLHKKCVNQYALYTYQSGQIIRTCCQVKAPIFKLYVAYRNFQHYKFTAPPGPLAEKIQTHTRHPNMLSVCAGLNNTYTYMHMLNHTFINTHTHTRTHTLTHTHTRTDPRKASTRVAYWRYSCNELGTHDVSAQLERLHNVKCTELGGAQVGMFSLSI